MPKTMKVEVRQEHIDRGIKGDCDFCPIVLALIDIGKQDVSVSDGGIEFREYSSKIDIFSYNETCKFYDHTRSTYKFIKDFDAGNPVKPFKFVLRERCGGKGRR